MKSRINRALKLAHYHLVCDCIACTSNFPATKAVGKHHFDVLTCRLIAVMDGVPEKDVTKLLPVTRDELRMFEEAAVNFLRKNDHLHPSIENFKIQFLLAQIWYLFMR